jgi:glycosyltransferase involved in cell wall biosynthesis
VAVAAENGAGPAVAATSASVVVVGHNEAEHVRGTVDALLDTTPAGTELIVVDDGSTDGGMDFLADGYRGARLVRPEERLGITRARNHGAALASGDVVVFSDAHVTPSSGWLEPLCEALADPEAGVVAPAISPMGRQDGRAYGFTWRAPSLTTAWLYRNDDGVATVPMLCGCFLALRRETFERLGGFDEGLVTWGLEDAELALRVWRAGYECRVVPESHVMHLFRPKFPYQVGWGVTLANVLRVGTVHFGPVAMTRVLAFYARNAHLGSCLERLVESDAWSRREQVAASSRYSAEAFFDRFGIEALQ